MAYKGFGGINESPRGGAGGFAGAGYMSSAGGTGVISPPACGPAPAPANDLAPWQEDDTVRTLDDAFARASQGMPGNWHGIVTTPWIPPYEVAISFTPDGSYAAKCDWSSNMCCVALYYGTDDNTPLKRYDLDWVTKERKVGGTIDIIFGDSTYGYYESGYQGELKNVELDATGNRLRFEFRNGGEYGPISFDLGRVSAP